MYAILFCQMIKVHKLLLSSLFYKFHVSRSELLHYHLFSCGTQWPTKQSYGPNEWQKHTHFGWSHFRLVYLQTKMSQRMVLVCDVPLSLGHTVGCAGRAHPWLDASPWKLIPFEGFFDFRSPDSFLVSNHTHRWKEKLRESLKAPCYMTCPKACLGHLI